MSSLGKVLIFSAPSGAGKTTIVRHLLSKLDSLSFSVSATTRVKREGEIHGRHYYFLTLDDFQQKITGDAFIEYEQVYEGLYYGTLKSEIERVWDLGKNVIMDVDVKGGIHLKEYFQDKALAVFVQPPRIEALRERLEYRATEDSLAQKQRLDKAVHELSFAPKFDCVLVNDDLSQAFKDAERIVLEFLGKS